jgi:hypothetical protein
LSTSNSGIISPNSFLTLDDVTGERNQDDKETVFALSKELLHGQQTLKKNVLTVTLAASVNLEPMDKGIV